MDQQKIDLYNQLEQRRESKVIGYFTSDRRGMETQISSDTLPIFIEHLDQIGATNRITLFLYTRGGETLAAWSLVNLIRNFCDDFEVIVPFNCHSAGTIICLGANRIIMTKQATLGPIDPSTNGPLNPQVIINGQQMKIPISVESVNAYIEMAKHELGITDQGAMAQILTNLSNQVHPLALGEVYRSKSQIQMLAKRLIRHQNLPADQEDKIISFLCSGSGSHDYTIYRKEGKNELGLNIEKPDDDLYGIIKSLYDIYESEMELRDPYNPNVYLAGVPTKDYVFRRSLIESIQGGTNVFLSEGQLIRQQIPGQMPGQSMIQDSRRFEGWKKESNNINLQA